MKTDLIFTACDMAADPASWKDFTAVPAASDEATRGTLACAALGLRLEVLAFRDPLGTRYDCLLHDTAGGDRAVSLAVSLPVRGDALVWHDDIRRSRRIVGRRVYENVGKASCGSGAIGVYPLGTVSGIGPDGAAFAKSMAIDPDAPAQFRTGFDGARGTLFLRYDVALVEETANFVSSARLRFVVFDSDPEWGFRSAFETFTRLYPHAFAVRCTSQGIWMPFTPIEGIERHGDFGFRFHEIHGAGSDFDNDNGYAAYNYTEPFTWWMGMPPDMPRTYDNAVALARKYASDECAGHSCHEKARALFASGMRKADGKFAVGFYKLPWCDGACWTLNPNPAQPGAPTGATVNWSDAAFARRHGPLSRLAGEYIDSTEGYTTPELNFDRKAFAYETEPLTFDARTKRPGILKGIAVFAFTREVARDLHGIGKTLFGNGLPYRFPWLLANFDVMGTETVWLGKDGSYAPEKDAQMAVWRTLSGKKPYLLLQNSDFSKFDRPMIERFMQRVAFYAFYPSFFSADAASNPYWADKALYERDRDLFRRYVPLIRELGEAGWEPVTLARSSNRRVFIERYGRRYLALCNDTLAPLRTRVKVEFPVPRAAVERIRGEKVAVSPSGALALTLGPQSTAIIDFATP